MCSCSACSEENVIDHYRAQQGEYTVRVTDATSERYTQHTTPAQNQSEALYDRYNYTHTVINCRLLTILNRLIEVPVTVEQTSPYAYAKGLLVAEYVSIASKYKLSVFRLHV